MKDWLVPPIVIPAAPILAFLGYGLFRALFDLSIRSHEGGRRESHVVPAGIAGIIAPASVAAAVAAIGLRLVEIT